MGKIAVIGAGSWGTALAQTLAAAGNEVVMWARKPEVADAITKEHHNPRYLNGVMLSDSISATSNLQKCAEHAEALVIVTPSRLTRQFAQNLFEYLNRQKPRTFLDAFRANNNRGALFNIWVRSQ